MIEPIRVSVTVGKKVTKNYQSYEVSITEDWAVGAIEGATKGESATAEAAVDNIRKALAKRIKRAVNEELGVQFELDPGQ